MIYSYSTLVGVLLFSICVLVFGILLISPGKCACAVTDFIITESYDGKSASIQLKVSRLSNDGNAPESFPMLDHTPVLDVPVFKRKYGEGSIHVCEIQGVVYSRITRVGELNPIVFDTIYGQRLFVLISGMMSSIVSSVGVTFKFMNRNKHIVTVNNFDERYM